MSNYFSKNLKYLREKRPDLKSNRVRIKKRYVPKSSKIEYTFPKKWNIENYE